MEESPKPITTGVKLWPETVRYLQALADSQLRDRSFLINVIVLQHARENRGKIPEPIRVIEI